MSLGWQADLSRYNSAVRDGCVRCHYPLRGLIRPWYNSTGSWHNSVGGGSQEHQFHVALGPLPWEFFTRSENVFGG